MRDRHADIGPTILLLILLNLCGVLSYVSIHAFEYPGATSHPIQAQMQIAGDAATADAELMPFGATVGCLIVLVFMSCLVIGAGKNGRDNGFRTVVAILAVLIMVVFMTMMLNVPGYLRGENSVIVGGFPLPTAMMLYGVWLCPLVFLAVYVFGFNRWVLTEADRDRLAELVANTSNDGDGD